MRVLRWKQCMSSRFVVLLFSGAPFAAETARGIGVTHHLFGASCSWHVLYRHPGPLLTSDIAAQVLRAILDGHSSGTILFTETTRSTNGPGELSKTRNFNSRVNASDVLYSRSGPLPHHRHRGAGGSSSPRCALQADPTSSGNDPGRPRHLLPDTRSVRWRNGKITLSGFSGRAYPTTNTTLRRTNPRAPLAALFTKTLLAAETLSVSRRYNIHKYCLLPPHHHHVASSPSSPLSSPLSPSPSSSPSPLPASSQQPLRDHPS